MRRRTANSGPTNPYPDLKSQKAFEKGLLEKTAKQTGDIILYDNRLVLYKTESDVMLYVVAGQDENEIMIYNAILALRDSLHLLFKYGTPSVIRRLALLLTNMSLLSTFPGNPSTSAP